MNRISEFTEHICFDFNVSLIPRDNKSACLPNFWKNTAPKQLHRPETRSFRVPKRCVHHPNKYNKSVVIKDGRCIHHLRYSLQSASGTISDLKITTLILSYSFALIIYYSSFFLSTKYSLILPLYKRLFIFASCISCIVDTYR